jgi:hypothetical protein
MSFYKQMAARATEVQMLIQELYVHPYFVIALRHDKSFRYGELDTIIMEEADNEDAIRALWSELYQSRVTHLVRIVVELLIIARYESDEGICVSRRN